VQGAKQAQAGVAQGRAAIQPLALSLLAAGRTRQQWEERRLAVTSTSQEVVGQAALISLMDPVLRPQVTPVRPRRSVVLVRLETTGLVQRHKLIRDPVAAAAGLRQQQLPKVASAGARAAMYES
jgi:hypothetical protein